MRVFLVLLLSVITAFSAPPGWREVFSDDFNKWDDAKWTTEMGFAGIHGPRFHNEFYQSYTCDDDVRASKGILSLQTQRRETTGPESPCVFHYTQGLVVSRFSFTYGYLEVRARFPQGAGLWPCIWLMPEARQWPPEVAVAELYQVAHVMHHGLAYGTAVAPEWDSDYNADDFTQWHVIELHWAPGYLCWLVDDIVVKTVVADYVPRIPMYLILSNSVGAPGSVAGIPDASTVFPNRLEISSVRIFQPGKGIAYNFMDDKLVKHGARFETGASRKAWGALPLLSAMWPKH
jgi:beta-glucanase (GH16 family)